jgi:hypothetical protein
MRAASHKQVIHLRLRRVLTLALLVFCSFYLMVSDKYGFPPATPLCFGHSHKDAMPVPSLPTEVLYMIVRQVIGDLWDDAADEGQRR